MTLARGLAPRLLVVAVLALGLVGMHHLVVAACHHGAAATSSGEAPLMLDAQHPTSHVAGHGLPASAPQDAPDDSPTGLMGAAATCLAILLMIAGLAAPRIVSRVQRALIPDPPTRVRPAAVWTPAPPDLALLSVSRT